MAFERQAARVANAIGRVEIHLLSPDPTGNEQPGAEYMVQVHYDNGERKVVRGNLVPHLSPAQINALLGFMDDMRQKAITEILP